MNFFSDKVCHPRHTAQYLFSMIWSSSKEQPEHSTKAIPISNNYSFEIYQQVEDLPHTWAELVQDRNVFIGSPFLSALQSSPPIGMQNRYLLLREAGQTVGVVLLQLIEYRLKETLKGLDGSSIQGWRQKLSYRFADILNFNLLVIGNLLLSGEHAFLFREGALSREKGVSLILEALPKIKTELQRSEGQKLSGVLIKDLEKSLSPAERGGLMHQVTFQPSMELNLQPGWSSREDYLIDLQSKYRVRARRAFKKAREIQVREWGLTQIAEHQAQLHELYQVVADKATFNMLHLHPSYFTSLKEDLREDFRLFAYKNPRGELIGFCTLIRNGKAYDAHFLGINEEANREYQLYLNMLFNMLGEAIEQAGINSIVFGRTALEIKSSIGAIPQEMYCYIKHFNPVFNLIIGWLIRKYDPVEEWQARHPFKRPQSVEA